MPLRNFAASVAAAMIIVPATFANAQEAPALTADQARNVDRLIDAALEDNLAWDVLESLTSFLQSLLFVPEQKSAEIRIHVKQDANRRIPPGRNPGSGGAR